MYIVWSAELRSARTQYTTLVLSRMCKLQTQMNTIENHEKRTTQVDNLFLFHNFCGLPVINVWVYVEIFQWTIVLQELCAKILLQCLDLTGQLKRKSSKMLSKTYHNTG